jgi:DNA-binding PadR family transcriptional regulator
MRRAHNEQFGGLIRLHILHHAARAPLCGSWLIEELQRHGYNLSPGTLYPMLHGMETKGYLRSLGRHDGKEKRRYYIITPSGKRALADARKKIREMFGELFESEADKQRSSRGRQRVGTRA